jgi:hypothetical protein
MGASVSFLSSAGMLFREAAWNKGKLVGAKPPLQPKHVWAKRFGWQVRDSDRT